LDTGFTAGFALAGAADFSTGLGSATAGGAEKVGAGGTASAGAVATCAGGTAAVVSDLAIGNKPVKAAMPASETVVTAMAAVATRGWMRVAVPVAAFAAVSVVVFMVSSWRDWLR
jgi:hypothetical protein